MQQTLKHPLTIKGIGLHSGCQVTLVINPAPENHGIVFRRVDLLGQPQIPALYTHVVDTLTALAWEMAKALWSAR